MAISRRDVLKIGALGAVGFGGVVLPFGRSLTAKSVSRLPSANMPKPYAVAFQRPPVLSPYRVDLGPDGVPVHHYSVIERAGSASIVPGLTTPVYGYFGYDHNTGRWVGGVPGPVISVDQGTPVVLRVRNHLPVTNPLSRATFATSTHLHGSASLPQYDGYANDLTPPGYYKDYQYPNFQAARTLWYHDHGVHVTAQNAYGGLAAQYHLHDPVERALLPQGEFDVPVTITDAMFAADGSLAYNDRSHSGLWGDIILVNGRPWPVMKVKRRVYRFRILNASIARSYRLTLSNGAPLTIVATDGGLMPRSQQVTTYRHGGAERYEVLIDFSTYPPGTKIDLRNLSNENNVDFDHTNKVMRFEVLDDPFDTTNNTVPTLLSGSPVMSLTAAQAVRTRHLRFHRENLRWAVNGKTWRDVVDSDFKLRVGNPGLGDVEIWEFENRSGGWFHPVHVHLVDFKVLSRNGRAPFAHERGPKDTVYVGENERVRLLMRFGPHRGRYMIHCHNLPHEDHDMMLQFSVGLDDPDSDPNHPIEAAPSKPDDLPAIDV